jgi:hypothetical protein
VHDQLSPGIRLATSIAGRRPRLGWARTGGDDRTDNARLAPDRGGASRRAPARELRLPDTNPRSVRLSIAGDVSVAYVFVHLLPELGEA